MRISIAYSLFRRKIEGIDLPKKYNEFLPENTEKSLYDYPYTYDPFIVSFNEKATQEATDSIYTDRLLLWDFDKHDRLCQKHFGDKRQQWGHRDEKKIEAFLSDWTGKKIVLVANIQYVNVSNGYPIWRLDYYEEKNA